MHMKRYSDYIAAKPIPQLNQIHCNILRWTNFISLISIHNQNPWRPLLKNDDHITTVQQRFVKFWHMKHLWYDLVIRTEIISKGIYKTTVNYWLINSFFKFSPRHVPSFHCPIKNGNMVVITLQFVRTDRDGPAFKLQYRILYFKTYTRLLYFVWIFTHILPGFFCVTGIIIWLVVRPRSSLEQPWKMYCIYSYYISLSHQTKAKQNHAHNSVVYPLFLSSTRCYSYRVSFIRQSHHGSVQGLFH